MVKSLKFRKTNRNKKTKRRRHRGGEKIRILLQQILITQPIINAVQKYRPDFDLDTEGFKMSTKEPGFRLSRMERMMEANIDELLENEPVELEHCFTAEGKKKGRKINGKGVLVYDIVNGRHRIARAIIEGKTEINADIVTP